MSALDADMRLTLRHELKSIQQEFGSTMVYITHDQEEALAMSDRIIVMDTGVIRQLDTPQNIVEHPADDYVQSFVLDNMKLKMVSLAGFNIA
jgi:ABC-type Fe3+/spermidine/putrescine transport system ATPase subunit